MLLPFNIVVMSLIFCNFYVLSSAIFCKDEDDRDIDWYINYKLPKLEEYPQTSLLGRGEAYAYVTPTSGAGKWILSKKKISSTTSMIGRTLSAFYREKESLTYLVYNDEPAVGDSGSSYGHTKGVVAFDEDSGFWLIHSIPKFPPAERYAYPSNGYENGQSIICVNFKTKSLNEIGKQLIFNHPSVYLKHATEKVLQQLDDDVKSLFSDKPKLITRKEFYRIITLKSINNVDFTSFAKDNQFKQDLYSELIAPTLKSSLFVETWRRGSGTFSPPYCTRPYIVQDVVSINMTLYSGKESQNIFFRSTEDHSKWAISVDSNGDWVCIGDINRMDSQKRRGGGSLCFSSQTTWKAFRSAIGEVDKC